MTSNHCSDTRVPREFEELLQLDRQLCFALYACSREITKMYHPHLEKLGITYPQFLVLLVLWEISPIHVAGLGERLYLDSGTLTPLLKRMEAMGLLTRTRAEEDERRVMIHITDYGSSLKTEATCMPYALMQSSDLSIAKYEQVLHDVRTLLRDVHNASKSL